MVIRFSLLIRSASYTSRTLPGGFSHVKEEKKSYAQVAEDMRISVKTVDAQLQKAMGKLKEAIRAYFG